MWFSQLSYTDIPVSGDSAKLVFLFLVPNALHKQLLLEPLVSNWPGITEPNTNEMHHEPKYMLQLITNISALAYKDSLTLVT
jgi:hypothetical protein